MTPIEQYQQRVTEAREHTPGPWEAIGGMDPVDNVYRFTIYTEATYPEGSVNNLNICSGYGGLSKGFALFENGEANANLIAAAPDLLEVAKHYEELLSSYGIDRIDGEEIADKALKLIRAAIAKATGAKP